MKKRCVIVQHPDFDIPGIEGIEQAKAYASMLDELRDEALKNANPNTVDQRTLDALPKFEFKVRNIPEEQL